MSIFTRGQFILFMHGAFNTIAAGATMALIPGLSGIQAAFNTLIPQICIMSSLHFRTGTAQPATGSMVVTAFKNGVATALTITVPAGAPAQTFMNHTAQVVFNEHDSFHLRMVNNAAAASAQVAEGVLLVTT